LGLWVWVEDLIWGLGLVVIVVLPHQLFGLSPQDVIMSTGFPKVVFCIMTLVFSLALFLYFVIVLYSLSLCFHFAVHCPHYLAAGSEYWII
jgi:hypothetical protein